MHWDEVYVIGLDGDIWSARFRGSADELRAHTSHELRELIRTDYTYRQQARVARRADGSAEVGRPNAGAPGSDGPELDDDDCDDAQYDDDGFGGDGVAQPPHGNFADIHGERMST